LQNSGKSRRNNNTIIEMKWVDALKQYNYGTGMYCVPKRGTAEYEAVLHIMNSDTTETVASKKKVMKTEKKDKTKRPRGKKTEKQTEKQTETEKPTENGKVIPIDKEYDDLMAELTEHGF
jgi:hypothetical protein